LKGNVIKYERDNIDTDVILPGTYLKLHDYDELATHAMEGIDPDFHTKVKEGDFIVAGKKFWLWLIKRTRTNCVISFWNKGSTSSIFCKNIL